MGVWARPSAPEWGNLGPCCRLLRRCLINRLLFVGANNDDAIGRPNSRSSTGRWADDTWYRRGTLQAGGPRSVRVCRSLKARSQKEAEGLAQITSLTPLVVGVAADGAWTRSAGAGRSAKTNSLVRALGSGRAVASVRGERRTELM
ncbi:hypothetical protein EVAR_91902_1 [Eumeta japonica]|uniref:Uncharacterized protein n=1 Tax=Eumeta variegata TaxID=151549 RepID=A0A4C1SYI9_EUMVA|nr:hypothetical protein EVAR_91902_1 [Eumeta japonica]